MLMRKSASRNYPRSAKKRDFFAAGRGTAAQKRVSTCKSTTKKVRRTLKLRKKAVAEFSKKKQMTLVWKENDRLSHTGREGRVE